MASVSKNSCPPTGELVEFALLARKMAGDLTIRQLELKTGISRGTLGRILNGDEVGYRKIISFAEGLKHSAGELLALLDKNFVPKNGVEADAVDVASAKLGLDPALLRQLSTAVTPGVDPEILLAVKLVLDEGLRAIDIEGWRQDALLFRKQTEETRRYLDAVQSGQIKRVQGHTRPRKKRVTLPDPPAGMLSAETIIEPAIDAPERVAR